MRTEEQTFANNLDCDLFRLITRAERRGGKDKHWQMVAEALYAARPRIRMRMHPKDVQETV